MGVTNRIAGSLVALGIVLASCAAPGATDQDLTPSTPSTSSTSSTPSTPSREGVGADAAAGSAAGSPPAQLSPADLSAASLRALGVELTDGFSPHEHLGRTDRMLNWPPSEEMPQGIGDPPVPEGLGPLIIEARIERRPISCLRWTRTIAAVHVGPGAAAERIAAAILAASEREHARFSEWFGIEADCDQVDPQSASGEGHTYHELAEQPCELPQGPALRCFVLAGFGYPPGAAHSYLLHHQLVFDSRDGMLLDLEDIFVAGGIDPEVGRSTADSIVRRVAGRPSVTLRQARPTADGLVFGFSPYEAGSWVEYTRDVFIPWRVLRMGMDAQP